ncbi:tumor protein p53-inducible protein 11-like isoform X2 [Hemiscyllium ocellatum]|uniref:tumor protein p53-inducible protein 11-like isoform X2 n=1 Tax=Hemiscyllium ocellatum TaxID=170820 RepID=UPI002965EA02|nr:tumor protein p53-inducible protein 11-like isoform X2 [Hemiscyllium ocellatum]
MAAKPQPPLVKKHSQTDLVSRLKTRKILGVGGKDDDGEIHRSKALIFPKRLYETVFDEDGSSTIMAVRLYGGALLSISLIMWHALYMAEKLIVRWTLLTETFYFSVQFIVTSALLFEKGALPQGASLLQFSRALFILISIYFYYQVGRKPRKM